MSGFVSILFLWIILQSSSINIEMSSVSNNNNNSSDKYPLPASRIKDEAESVWVEFIQLALDNKPLNLGQGFPDFAAPDYLIESLKNATSVQYEGSKAILANQYTRSFGHPRLVKALARYYRDFKHFSELEDANEQILITVGAYEALFTAIMAFVEPGDEVILIDPAFDAYEPMVRLAGGKSVFVPLRYSAPEKKSSNETYSSSSDFKINIEELRSKVTPRTKLLLLNTPNNPLGKMYSKSELVEIAKVCIEHNLVVVADEVYEQMYYEKEHVSIAQVLPEMWSRTVTIGSAGKTFSVTGWKIGWAFGARHLLRYMQLVHQTAIYTVATPLQESIARAFEHEMDLIESSNSSSAYWTELRRDLSGKRKRMADILGRAQLRPVVPEGGYFMLADFTRLERLYPAYSSQGESKSTGRSNSNDYKFARWLSREKRLQGIPASAFYSAENKSLGSQMIRFCFIKQDATLDSLESLINGILAANVSPASNTSVASAQPKRARL